MRAAALAAILAATAVLAQIAYPLTSGPGRRGLTVAVVLLAAAAVLAHAAAVGGRRAAVRMLVLTAGVGFAAEAVGVATGLPFGHYAYSGTLGPRVAGVPLVVPFAWTMMGWPAFAVDRRLGRPVLGGALALVSWDLFLDPQLVADGHWHYLDRGWALNGIPLLNTVGWLVVGLVVMALLDRLVGSALPPRWDDRLPLALYGWAYVGSLVANLFFFHRPWVALVGGLGMGVPVALLVRRLVGGGRRVALRVR